MRWMPSSESLLSALSSHPVLRSFGPCSGPALRGARGLSVSRRPCSPRLFRPPGWCLSGAPSSRFRHPPSRGLPESLSLVLVLGFLWSFPQFNYRPSTKVCLPSWMEVCTISRASAHSHVPERRPVAAPRRPRARLLGLRMQAKLRGARAIQMEPRRVPRPAALRSQPRDPPRLRQPCPPIHEANGNHARYHRRKMLMPSRTSIPNTSCLLVSS